jgi:hypothetical protein
MFARGFLSFLLAPFPYPGYKRALSALSQFSLAFVFRRLRTLSFSVSTLSRVPSTTCALSSQKPGGYPLMWSYQVSSALAKGCRLIADGCLPSPFTASLTQKQGGGGAWSYQFQLHRRPFVFAGHGERGWHKSQRYILERGIEKRRRSGARAGVESGWESLGGVLSSKDLRYGNRGLVI